MAWNPAFFRILGRAELGGDWLREEEATELVRAVAGDDWVKGITRYNWLDSSWRIGSLHGKRAWHVSADGTVTELENDD